MPFEDDDPVYLYRSLCSVELFAPSQIQHPDGEFALMANAWFGTTRVDDIPTKDGPQSFTLGVHAALLSIATCTDSRMRAQGRFRSEPLTLTFDAESRMASNSGRKGSVSGGVSIPLLKVFTAKGDGTLSGGKESNAAENRGQDATFELYEVDTASPTDWLVQALNPARPVPYLKGAVLREAPLCTISTPRGQGTVTARIAVSAKDLWLEADSRGAALEDEANQNAVLQAIAVKATEERSLALFREDGDDDMLVVAEATLHRRKAPDAEDQE